jgi:hypothetical protein
VQFPWRRKLTLFGYKNVAYQTGAKGFFGGSMLRDISALGYASCLASEKWKRSYGEDIIFNEIWFFGRVRQASAAFRCLPSSSRQLPSCLPTLQITEKMNDLFRFEFCIYAPTLYLRNGPRSGSVLATRNFLKSRLLRHISVRRIAIGATTDRLIADGSPHVKRSGSRQHRFIRSLVVGLALV